MIEHLVCPDCGNDEFSREAAARLRLIGTVYTGLGFEATSEEAIDIERDYDEVRCTDCTRSYNPAELVTEAQYNGKCPACGELTLDSGGLCDNCGHYARTELSS